MAPLAVRSSAIDEDTSAHSFAGLHESVLNVSSEAGLLDAVRIVWASLWSDAALLYRSELSLSPSGSAMAVLVQEMVETDCSGVAFAEDPRGGNSDVAIIEAVSGTCNQLVDGLIDPDHWEIDRKSKSIRSRLSGYNPGNVTPEPVLNEDEVISLFRVLEKVDARYDWSADIEWTGRHPSIYLLQARPITTTSLKAEKDEDDKRAWYLTLRPGDERLKKLRQRVDGELIPKLRSEGIRLSQERLEHYSDRELSNAIEERGELVDLWKKIYWDDFIPFAHGVRRLATYYNDAVHPEDPYEFVGLLKNQPMLATERNSALQTLARELIGDPELKARVRNIIDENADGLTTKNITEIVAKIPELQKFLHSVVSVYEEFFDISYEGFRLCDDLPGILHVICEMADKDAKATVGMGTKDTAQLESRLLSAVGPEREEEAKEVLDTARISWTLRDDDNLLLARIESQHLRAVELGAQRLREQKRLRGRLSVNKESTDAIVSALQRKSNEVVELYYDPRIAKQDQSQSSVSPRQLVGQPASPGLATGVIRRITGPKDLGAFRAGEILVCDAIQPMMTHIVPLASAIVERRGGMLIHGAIIARELGIPCVNGVRNASSILSNGQMVSVDGNLGIVTIGGPCF
jgi:pyruvate,water dikinase